MFGEQAVQAARETGVEDRQWGGGVGVEHDFVELLRGSARLGEVEVLDLALAFLVRGFLVGGGAELVDGVAGGGVSVVLLGGRGLEGGDRGRAIGVTIGSVAIFVVEVLFVGGVELVC